MTKVFVHGNPESAAIWRPLIAELGALGVDDVIALSPPGFGAATPEGWTATPANYVDWLADELTRVDGPIDLLGHDWGAGHVFGLAADRPDLIRSWACDVAGLLHPDYEWHDGAQTWQTPGEGEQWIERTLALSTDDRAGIYAGRLGLPPDVAVGFEDHDGRYLICPICLGLWEEPQLSVKRNGDKC